MTEGVSSRIIDETRKRGTRNWYGWNPPSESSSSKGEWVEEGRAEYAKGEREDGGDLKAACGRRAREQEGKRSRGRTRTLTKQRDGKAAQQRAQGRRAAKAEAAVQTAEKRQGGAAEGEDEARGACESGRGRTTGGSRRHRGRRPARQWAGGEAGRAWARRAVADGVFGAVGGDKREAGGSKNGGPHGSGRAGRQRAPGQGGRWSSSWAKAKTKAQSDVMGSISPRARKQTRRVPFWEITAPKRGGGRAFERRAEILMWAARALPSAEGGKSARAPGDAVGQVAEGAGGGQKGARAIASRAPCEVQIGGRKPKRREFPIGIDGGAMTIAIAGRGRLTRGNRSKRVFVMLIWRRKVDIFNCSWKRDDSDECKVWRN
ncbi:hypothetical protein C8R45DRAFT_947122 [Mycena sanguinolenta]|nr:hypothetical protein C8R45DRAFT_947122 [Mycena sanguinolenta]